jgi:hypothetical protein
MAKFMVLYRASRSAREQMSGMTPEQAQAGMEPWTKWASSAGDAIVDLGSPLTTVATLGTAPGDDGGQAIAGFSILEAESGDAVTKLLEEHPHFHTPGPTSIQVLELLPIPGT